MKVLQTGIMTDGTKIQIEEWKENYSFMSYASTIASYPKSKVSHEGSYSPKGNKEYRFSFNFESEEQTKEMFNSLLSGNKQLKDLVQYMHNSKYADCL